MISLSKLACLSAAVLVAMFIGLHCAQEDLQAQDKQAPQKDKYAFEWRDYEKNTKQGFAEGLKLVRKAEAENAPPQTVARLYYHIARIRRSESLSVDAAKADSNSDDEQHFQPTIRPTLTILNKVLKDPERFLSNDASAVWYANCTNLLLSVYRRKGDSRAELKQAIETAMSSVDSAEQLSDARKLVINANIRLGCSDVALNDNDWDAAIKWLQPTIDSAKDYMFDGRSVATLAMTVRQQSMFIAEKKLWDQSADLIDETCQNFEEADIEENDRLKALCMLRGKTFINFSQNQGHPRAMEGWKHYQAISKRANSHMGPNRQWVLYSTLNMDRVVSSCILRHDGDKAIIAANNAVTTLEANVDLLSTEPSIVTMGLDATDSVYRGLGRGDKRREPLKIRIDAVVKRYIEKGVNESLLKKYTQ